MCRCAAWSGIWPADAPPAVWPRPCSGTGPKPEKKARVQAWLAARLDAAAHATLAEHATAFAEQTGVVVSTAAMSRSLSTLPVDDPAQAVTPSGRARRPGRPLKGKA